MFQIKSSSELCLKFSKILHIHALVFSREPFAWRLSLKHCLLVDLIVVSYSYSCINLATKKRSIDYPLGKINFSLDPLFIDNPPSYLLLFKIKISCWFISRWPSSSWGVFRIYPSCYVMGPIIAVFLASKLPCKWLWFLCLTQLNFLTHSERLLLRMKLLS